MRSIAACPWTLLGDITGTTVASLALAVGFAGLSEVGNSGFSLLAQLQAAWFRLQSRRPNRFGPTASAGPIGSGRIRTK